MAGDRYFLLVVFCLIATALASPLEETVLTRNKRDVSNTLLSPLDRDGCPPGITSNLQVNTTDRLAALRVLFPTAAGTGIDAYIVPSEDAHASEYPSDYDRRRGYISGFTGSAGTAVVTATKAALWTDGRYFLEAEQELDCNWILMKSGVEGVPTISEWLIDEMKTLGKNNPRVGASPFLISSSSWKSYQTTFSKENITMTKVTPDLIDEIWTTDRPQQPDTPINAHEMKFAGKTWEAKIADLRKDMTEKGAAAFVVTSLDETAWLFNARAKDIAYNPFFISYAIVEVDRIRLYILNATTKLSQEPTDSETTKRLYVHLNTNPDGSCGVGATPPCVEVLEYNADQVVAAVTEIASRAGQPKVWVTYYCNFAIYDAIPEGQRIQDKSTVALKKSMKNEVERQGMRDSHVRDAVALVSFMAMLENEVKAGRYWSEVSAAEKLKEYRSNQQYNRGLSFSSISGVGSNGAIIHYRPQPSTDKQITTREMYLLDSGGQYLDGTTDVTRTFHFGTPTNYEKECYTRVLMGHIDLAMAKWPEGLYGREIDALARRPLWDVGLIYRHGTGHGIGAYLSVHEGPGRISLSHSVNPSEETLHEYMFFSDEPGYYEDGQFGIRIETIVMVDFARTKYNYENTTFLGFDVITLVPLEPNLIVTEMLSDSQLAWVNQYHKQVEDTLKPMLSDNAEALQWMTSRTKPIQRPTQQPVDSAAKDTSAILLLFMSFILIKFVI